jgi:uncharacterized protein
MDRVEAHIQPPPSREDITEAFWGACHGGQQSMAEYLLARAPTSPGSAGTTSPPPDAARRSGAAALAAWLSQRDARSTGQ